MAAGYALLAQELTINGTASIDSTWKVEITNITSKNVVGDAVNKTDPTHNGTTANFSVGLTQPGDSITYDIEITNKGTLDAVVESITVNKGDNPAIVYTTSGLKRGDKIAKNNGTNTLTLKVDYDSSITSQPASTTNDITVTINYQQDLGQIEPEYGAYSIGDTVEFAGSNWKVIKASTTNDNYITLLKETILTTEELGNYAISTNETHYDTMAYYWSDSCHQSGYAYGTNTYTTFDDSGCDGHNNYEGSKVKEFLEEIYINTLGASNLKEVDGYKIRLITLEELTTNLGYEYDGVGTSYRFNSNNTPNWVYQNYNGSQTNVESYWTMTSKNANDNYYSTDVYRKSGVWTVHSNGYI